MILQRTLTFLVIIWSNYELIFGDDQMLFSSTHELERLIRSELKFSDALDKYATALEEEAKKIREYKEKVYPEKLEISNPEKYISNPLNCLRMTERTGFQFRNRDLDELLKNNTLVELRETLNNASSIFPSTKDHEDACSCVALLYETYELNHTQIADGIISVEGGTYQTNPIDWNILHQIGIASINRGWYDSAYKWLTLAEERYDGSYPKQFEQMLKQKADGIKIHDHFLDKRGPISEKHRTFAVPFDQNLRKKKKYKKARKNPVVKKIEERLPIYELMDIGAGKKLEDNFHILCRDGEKEFRTPELDKKLKCKFLTQNNPYLKLGPFKLEEKSDLPFIVILHDFMYEEEMEYFKDYAKPRLVPSEFGGDKTGLLRTSKQCWLNEKWYSFPNETFKRVNYEEMKLYGYMPIPAHKEKYFIVKDEVAYKVSKRIERATTFELIAPFASEQYQVANYGLGGQYGQHVDPVGLYDGTQSKLTQNFKDSGDRIATFMAYLTDVELGGGTSYPLTGVRISARKGSAAFWVNLKADGTRDVLTYHGGCPVLVGSKWITNKWIGYHDQFDKVPCKANTEDQVIRFFEDWKYF